MGAGSGVIRPPLLVLPDDEASDASDLPGFAAALPQFLARLGFAGWDVAPLAQLDAAAVAGRPLVIVASAPEGQWCETSIAALAAFDGPMLIEGPLPAEAARRLLAVTTHETCEPFAGTFVPEAPPAQWSHDALLAHVGRSISFAEPMPLSRVWERLVLGNATPRPDPLLGSDEWRPALAYLANASARLAERETFYVHPRVILQAATLLIRGAVVLADRVPPAGWPHDPFQWSYANSVRLLQRLARALSRGEARLDWRDSVDMMGGATRVAPEDEGIDFAALEPLAIETMEFLDAAVELSTATSDGASSQYRRLLEAARPLALLGAQRDEAVEWVLAGSPADASAGKPQRALPAARLAALRLWAQHTGAPTRIVAPSPDCVPTPASVEDAMRLKDVALCAGPENGPIVAAVRVAGEQLLAALEAGERVSDCARIVVYTAAAAAHSGLDDVARQLARAAAAMRDEASGLLRDDALRTSAEVGLCLFTALLPTLIGRRARSAHADDRLLERWRRGVASHQAWTIHGGETRTILNVIEASEDSAEEGEDLAATPLLVRLGSRLGLAFPMLTWAVAECSPPPPPPGRQYVSFAAAKETFALTIAIVEALWLAAGQGRPLVWPWPAVAGATVRHDADPIPAASWLAPILAGEAECRQASTYGFSPARFATPLRELLEDCGHEIAVRGGHPARVAEELRAVRDWATTPVVGWTADADSDATSLPTGARTWAAAAEAGSSYAAFGSRHSAAFPLPPVVLDDAGTGASVLDLDVFDVDAEVGPDFADCFEDGSDQRLATLADECLRRRDHCCLNSNSGLSGEVHSALVAHITARMGARAWWGTLAEIAQRRRDTLAVEIRQQDGGLELRTAVDVPGFQLVLAPPPGHVLCVVEDQGDPREQLTPGSAPGIYALDLLAGHPVRIGWVGADTAANLPVTSPSPIQPRHRGISPSEVVDQLSRRGIRLPTESSFSDFRELIEEGVREVYERVGDSHGMGVSKAPIEYNGVGVPRRGAMIKDLLERAYGLSLEGRAVLDLGAGFGGVGLWLLADGGAAALAACELDEDRLGVLRQVVAETGLTGVTAKALPFEQLELSPASFDLAIFVDVFIYGGFEMGAILAKVRDALRPGGVVVIKTANRWAPADIFTGAAGLHFLPHRLAIRALQFLTGTGASYEDKRLVSPYDLLRLTEASGFTDFRLQQDDARAPSALAIHTGFFYFAARKPSAVAAGEEMGLPSPRSRRVVDG